MVARVGVVGIGHAAIAGTVKAVNVAKGDRVNPGEILIEIEA